MTPIVDAFAGQLPAELWYGIGTIGSIVLAGNMSIPFIVKEFAEDSNWKILTLLSRSPKRESARQS